MTDEFARKIMDGRVGDHFQVSKDYKGKYINAVGVPLDSPHGRAYPIPAGTDGNTVKDTVVIQRPDFRKEKKNSSVFK
ncbi:unnamed protein product [Auanema sp. JU1783]|nr:unnamed protein product [Auanema sp. JU1783]